ncbi:MAG: hypothetical protein IPK75_03135 [Acidobacteria bacterium]|nr:hypothetical protein [Acidobacteriota bacterium]
MADEPEDKEKRKPSKRVTLTMAREFHNLRDRGWFVNRIAAEFDVNPGRVSEVLNGHKFPEAGGPEQPTLI